MTLLPYNSPSMGSRTVAWQAVNPAYVALISADRVYCDDVEPLVTYVVGTMEFRVWMLPERFMAMLKADWS